MINHTGKERKENNETCIVYASYNVHHQFMDAPRRQCTTTTHHLTCSTATEISCVGAVFECNCCLGNSLFLRPWFVFPLCPLWRAVTARHEARNIGVPFLPKVHSHRYNTHNGWNRIVTQLIKMADDKEPSTNEQQRLPLRRVETDVLIPKIMREKAKDICKEYVKGDWCIHALNTLELKNTLASYKNFIFNLHVISYGLGKLDHRYSGRLSMVGFVQKRLMTRNRLDPCIIHSCMHCTSFAS